MLLWISIATYLLSGLLALGSAFRQQSLPKLAIFLPAVIGLLAHTSWLASEIFVAGAFHFSLLNSLSVCIWMTIGIVVIASLTRPVHSLFTFFMPAGSALLIIALNAPQLAAPKDYSQGTLVHIFLSLLAYSIILVTTLQAILVQLQGRLLHKHQLNGRLLTLLPPLQSMERLMFEWLLIGFVLLTAAIISGGLYVDNLFAQHLAHKTLLTLIAWGFFATLLFGHFYLGWRGDRASRLIYLGFAFLFVAYIGSQFVLEYLLQRQ